MPELFIIGEKPLTISEISRIISENESNIQSVLTKILDENFMELTAKILVKDTKHLDVINRKLMKSKTVSSVTRQAL